MRFPAPALAQQRAGERYPRILPGATLSGETLGQMGPLPPFLRNKRLSFALVWKMNALLALSSPDALACR